MIYKCIVIFFRTYETWTCQHCSQYNLMLSHIIKQQQQQNHAMNNHYIVRVQTPYDGSKSYIVPYEKWNVFVRNLREYVYILFLFFILKKNNNNKNIIEKREKHNIFLLNWIVYRSAHLLSESLVYCKLYVCVYAK